MAYFPAKHWDSGADKWDKTTENPNFPHYFYYYEADLYIDDVVKTAKIALELGSGSCGSTIRHVSASTRIVAVDYSPSMLKIGKQKLLAAEQSDNVDLICSDICNLPLRSEVFDAVFSRGLALSYASDPKRLAQEARRVLKGQGSLGIDFMNGAHAKKTRPEFCRFEPIGDALYYVEQFVEDGKQKRTGYRLPKDFKPPQPLEGSVFGGFRAKPDWLNLDGVEKEEWWAVFYTPAEARRLFRSAGFKRVRLFPLGCFTYGQRNKDLANFLKDNRDIISKLQKDLAKVFRMDRAVHIFLTASKPESLS